MNEINPDINISNLTLMRNESIVLLRYSAIEILQSRPITDLQYVHKDRLLSLYLVVACQYETKIRCGSNHVIPISFSFMESRGRKMILRFQNISASNALVLYSQ